jgi:hypothetical protein
MSSTAAILNPQVRLQPPMPPATGSKFSKMARGPTKEIEEAQHAHHHVEGCRPASSAAGDKNLFDPKKFKLESICLTSVVAVESPAKLDVAVRPWMNLAAHLIIKMVP